MGRLVSNSFNRPLPFSTSSLPDISTPLLPKALAELSIGAHGFEEGVLTGDWRGGDLTLGENERLPSGGGESARFVSGDWS